MKHPDITHRPLPKGFDGRFPLAADHEDRRLLQEQWRRGLLPCRPERRNLGLVFHSPVTCQFALPAEFWPRRVFHLPPPPIIFNTTPLSFWGPKALDRVCALGLASVLQFVACSVFRGEFRMPRDAETFPGCKAHRQWMLPVDELFHLLGCFPEWARDSPPRSVGNQVNEFYKKRCQGKSSASTGGSKSFLEIQPTLYCYL